VNVANNTSVANIPVANEITVYPNPATDVININLNGTAAQEVAMLDMQGRIVKEVKVGSNNTVTIPVQGIAPGIYVMQVHTSNNVITQKVTITK
jgi:hypothetical protein